MLQVYDRVLPSRSVPTLVGLLLLVVMLYAIQGALDLIRGRMLVRIGRSLDEDVSIDAFRAVVLSPLKFETASDGLQPLRDLDQVRSFLSSPGPTALFDLPWMPLYLALCFAFHFWIGIAASVGALLLVVLTVLTEYLSRSPTNAAASYASQRLSLAETSRRNAEALEAMGMTGRLASKWAVANTNYMHAQQQAADVSGTFGSLSRMCRFLLQSTTLAVGAYLVIHQEVTAGVIVASSILTSRAMAPVELAIAHWRSYLSARQSWQRLSNLMDVLDLGQGQPLSLPAPTENLSLESVTIFPPGVTRSVIQDVTFTLKSGQALGIIGPSASGKTSLARAIVGVWPPLRGKIRLDGAALDQWSHSHLGLHVGYLPQNVELIAGTIADNISRFVVGAAPATVIAAAQAAGAHQLILRLPEGYNTDVGEAGTKLSAGQRQRIGLARALYGNPFLVVLDEPNSNLDAEGDDALTEAIRGVVRRGGIAIVVAHRPSALSAVDFVLALSNGRSQAFGPRDDVLQKILKPMAQISRIHEPETSGVGA